MTDISKSASFASPLSPHVVRPVGARELVNGERTEAFRLRYKVIVEILRWWKPTDGTGLEVDEYDQWASHFGVIWERGLVAYARLYISTDPRDYMMFNTFAKILGDKKDEILANIDPTVSAEISRLVTDPTLEKHERALAVMQLYRRLGQRAIAEKRTKWYIVVSKGLAQKFSEMEFVFESLAEGKFFETDDLCVALCLDVLATRAHMKQNCPELYEIFFSEEYEPLLPPGKLAEHDHKHT